MYRGYIKLWRRTQDSGLLRHPHALQLFIWLLLNASHKSYQTSVCGTVLTLQPGQIIVTRKRLADELGISEQRIRTAFQILKKLEFLTSTATNRFSLITIINWHTYQQDNIDINQQTHRQSTNSQPTEPAHQLENKNDKNKIQCAPARVCARARVEEGTEAPQPSPPKPQPFRPPQPSPKAGKAGGTAAHEGEGVPKRRTVVDPDILSGKKAPPMWKKQCYEEPDYEILDGVRYSKDELIEKRRHWLGRITNSLRYPAPGAESGVLRVESEDLRMEGRA